MSRFRWSEIPLNAQGFVHYEAIPSFPVRQIVAEGEHVKLIEELKAREKWAKSDANDARLRSIRNQLRMLRNVYLP